MDTTFIITAYGRSVRPAWKSVHNLYPGAEILTEDTEGNLSRGRNRLVDQVTTPYVFLMEEDMKLFEPIEPLVSLLRRSRRLMGVSGGMIERRRIRAMAINFAEGLDAIHLVDSKRVSPDNGHILADCCYNFGLFKTDVLRRVRWEERLELAEHFEFFWRASREGYRIAVTPYRIIHRSMPTSAKYLLGRRRVRQFKHIEREIVGKRFVRRGTTHNRHWGKLHSG